MGSAANVVHRKKISCSYQISLLNWQFPDLWPHRSIPGYAVEVKRIFLLKNPEKLCGRGYFFDLGYPEACV